MKKFKIETAYLIDSFKEHKKYKNKLLNLFKKENFNINKIDNYYTDNISKLDWNKCEDFKREWIQLIKEDILKFFKKQTNELGYQEVKLHQIWFQQYKKNGTHGWHIHGHNYTGVYYVDFGKEDAKTELINQFDQNKILTIEAKEGDIVIFPSFIIHRSPIQKINKTKTIISFNLEFSKIEKKLLEKLNQNQ